MNSLCSEVEALQVKANELVESHNRQYRYRSPKPKMCKTCTHTNAESCNHCFFGSSEHLQIGCLKNVIKKLKQVASVGNERTNVNIESHICLNCEKRVKQVTQFYRCSKCKSGMYWSKSC